MDGKQHEAAIDEQVTALREAHRQFRFEWYRAGGTCTHEARRVAADAVSDLDVLPAAVARFCRTTQLDVDDGVLLFLLYREVAPDGLDL